jgi:hypothetical protein
LTRAASGATGPGRGVQEEIAMQHKNTKMPASVHEVFSRLEDDLIWLRTKWTLFRVVYTEDPNRVPLLNRFAGEFLGIAQRVFVDDVILSLGRLLDKTRGRDNLSLKQLVDRIRGSGSPKLADDLDALLKSVQPQIDSLVKHRHKRLAHRDLNVAIGVRSLPGITIKNIDDVLGAVTRMFAGVLMEYDQVEASFDPLDVDSGPRQLIHNIEEWDATRQKRRGQ